MGSPMNEYATDKLGSHPEIVAKLRKGESTLTSVHLMPQNLCNHSCSFCSYRLPDNKIVKSSTKGSISRQE